MFQTERVVGILKRGSVQATQAIGSNRDGDPLIFLNPVIRVGSLLETDINGKALLVQIPDGKTDDPFFRMLYKQVL